MTTLPQAESAQPSQSSQTLSRILCIADQQATTLCKLKAFLDAREWAELTNHDLRAALHEAVCGCVDRLEEQTDAILQTGRQTGKRGEE